MEATWGPDHITTVPEDYAQHVILGVCPIMSSTKFLLILCLSFDGLFLTSGCYLFQALCLLRLVTHLESQALDLKREALESLSIGVGGTKAAAIWDVITGAFALQSEPVIHPFSDYSGKTPDKDPFDIMDPAPAISRPLGYDVAAAPGYKPVDHIRAALHHMQISIPPVTSPDALGPLLIPDDPSNPASHTQVKATAAQQRCAASGLPACVSPMEATLAFPVSKEKMSATGIPKKYISKQLTALPPKDSLYACTFEGCDHIFKQLAGVYNHLRCLHLGVTVGCYYCLGRWWTSKGWSDHHTREHPLSNPSPLGADSESLLVKKAQASVATESKAAFPAPGVDDFPGAEAHSSTSLEEDEEDDTPPVPSYHTILHLLPLPGLLSPHPRVLEELVHISPLLLGVPVIIRRHCLTILLVPELLHCSGSVLFILVFSC